MSLERSLPAAGHKPPMGPTCRLRTLGACHCQIAKTWRHPFPDVIDNPHRRRVQFMSKKYEVIATSMRTPSYFTSPASQR
jgi:hypothetical protein